MGTRIESIGKTINLFPSNLSGGDLIMPRSDRSRSEGLNFNANDHIEIFGAFKPETSLTGNWIDAKQTVTASDGTGFLLRRLRLPAGATASFAPGNDTPLFAFVRAVRPSASYDPVRLASGGTAWTIQVGVGDRYGLNFNYRNITAAAISATLEIVQANGSILRTDPLEFAPSASKTDWSVLRIRTGASINAGTYTLRVKTPSPDSLQLNTLEVE